MTSKCVLQDWVTDLNYMQQTVLLSALRGPDGVTKFSPTKFILRWHRRCVLIPALDGCVLDSPFDPRGGSYTGPCPADVVGRHGDWESSMNGIVESCLKNIDAMPHHFHTHLMHAIQILGYKHSDDRIRRWWHKTYLKFVDDMHLHPETEQEMDERLNDDTCRGDA